MTLSHLTMLHDHLLKNPQALWGAANQVPATDPLEPMQLRQASLNAKNDERRDYAFIAALLTNLWPNIPIVSKNLFPYPRLREHWHWAL